MSRREEIDNELTGQFGANLGALAPGWFGDCIHVCAPGVSDVTLCRLPVGEVADAASMDSGKKPSSFSGCWTCLGESNRWAT